MAAIVKNHIIKHLSKFTKGLSADKINFNTFKGEGELCNLELDEEVLTDFLALPSWLRLTQAICNRVSFKIPWTKLKSDPIQLSLGEVTIIVETCDQLRTMNDHATSLSNGQPTKYSFTDKVIESVIVTIETVKIIFKSPAFVSDIELSKIIVQSKSPDWKECELSYTRLKNSAGTQILLFKEIKWQTKKIEARSTVEKSLAPVKLYLRGTSRCRIILKKSISDCSILGARLAILLDDIIWDLTDMQLQSALHFLDSILGLIQKATENTIKQKADKKLKTFLESKVEHKKSDKTSWATTDAFSEYDVVETSYHFLARRINLCFSDDISAGRSCHPELLNGRTFHINLRYFIVDLYPYHLAVADRNHWLSYKNYVTPIPEWIQEATESFGKSLLNIVGDEQIRTTDESLKNIAWQHEGNVTRQIRNYVESRLKKIMTSCTVIKIIDLSLYQNISTPNKKQIPKDFISDDKDKWYLPENYPVLHAEFISSYLPDDSVFPLPSPKLFVHLNPIRVRFDIVSILWLNSLVLNLQQSLKQMSTGQDSSSLSSFYVDVKIEAIQPRIIFESAVDHPGQKDRPKSLHIVSSRLTVTNYRSGRSSRADLKKCIDALEMCSLFFNSDFPSVSTDFSVFNQKFVHHVDGTDNVRNLPQPLNSKNSMSYALAQMQPDMLWTEARDVWSIHLEPVFGDFYGTRALGKDHPVPFLDAFPITFWISCNTTASQDSKNDRVKTADMHVLAHISTLVSVQLNHYQYLFLLRLTEEIKELTTYLGLDTECTNNSSSKATRVFGAVLPQVEVTLVMPSQSPGKESSGGDVESVYPDSSSLQDDVAASGNWHSSNSFPGQLAANAEKKLPVSGMALDLYGSSNSQSIPQSNSNLKTANGAAKIPPLGGRASSADVINLSFQNSDPFTSLVSSIKKKIDKVMTLDIATKNSPDEISDTISVRSDASSNSDVPVFSGEYSGSTLEQFTLDGMVSLLNMNDASQFQCVEIASEVNEDTLTSPSERDSFASYCRRRDLISISTFKLGKVEIMKQSEGLSDAMKFHISSISLEECTSIPWDEFQNKFSSRSRNWSEVPLHEWILPRVRLRLTNAPKPEYEDFQKISLVDRNSVLTWFEGLLDMRVQAVFLNVNASTLRGLSDLVEDEVFPVPRRIPVNVHVEDVKLHIIEDRPPNNITSPGPIPVDVVIPELNVYINEDGVIEIRQQKKQDVAMRSSEVDAQGVKTQEVISENEELRRRLSAMESICQEYYRLKAEREETENNFRSQLAAAQDVISQLLENKKKLLDNLTSLNVQLESTRNSKR